MCYYRFLNWRDTLSQLILTFKTNDSWFPDAIVNEPLVDNGASCTKCNDFLVS